LTISVIVRRGLYIIDIGIADEIDEELVEWIREAYEIKDEQLKAVYLHTFKIKKTELWKTRFFARVAVCHWTSPK
jgi:hypothetical protein